MQNSSSDIVSERPPLGQTGKYSPWIQIMSPQMLPKNAAIFQSYFLWNVSPTFAILDGPMGKLFHTFVNEIVKKTCHFIYWSNNTTAALVVHILVYRKFVHFIRGHWTIRILPRFSYKIPRPSHPMAQLEYTYILYFWHAYSFNLFQGRKSENYIQIL